MDLTSLITSPLHEVEPGLHSVLQEGQRTAHYDDIEIVQPV